MLNPLTGDLIHRINLYGFFYIFVKEDLSLHCCGCCQEEMPEPSSNTRLTCMHEDAKVALPWTC